MRSYGDDPEAQPAIAPHFNVIEATMPGTAFTGCPAGWTNENRCGRSACAATTQPSTSCPFAESNRPSQGILPTIAGLSRTMVLVQAEHERREQQTAGRKKTKRQLAMEARAEEMEKARNRSFSAIYKQLARSFHPDLEQDETLKKEKEELMKQLTSAYEAKDLHTLLKLEAQWLSSNSANIQSLTEEKLSIYNAVLKEQVAELEVEYHRTFGHPRFEPLMQYGIHLVKGLIRSIDHREEVMRMTIGKMHESIAKLKGKDALKEVRATIRMVGSI
jgi:hypothetical protein